MTDAFLHIHAQHCQHDEAFIIGNRDALIALRTAIDNVLTHNTPQIVDAFVSDGEGFEAHIVLRTDTEMSTEVVPYEYRRDSSSEQDDH